MRSFASHRVSCRAAITVAERSIATTVPHAGSVTRIGVSSTIVESAVRLHIAGDDACPHDRHGLDAQPLQRGQKSSRTGRKKPRYS